MLNFEVEMIDSEGTTMMGAYIVQGIVVASQKDIAVNRAVFEASEPEAYI